MRDRTERNCIWRLRGILNTSQMYGVSRNFFPSLWERQMVNIVNGGPQLIEKLFRKKTKQKKRYFPHSCHWHTMVLVAKRPKTDAAK